MGTTWLVEPLTWGAFLHIMMFWEKRSKIMYECTLHKTTFDIAKEPCWQCYKYWEGE